MTGSVVMGRDDLVRNLQDDLERNAALALTPHDHALWEQAEKNTVYADGKTVSDEYNRLMLAKLFPHKRSLWSRLFGG
jgi:hypothetical protein